MPYESRIVVVMIIILSQRSGKVILRVSKGCLSQQASLAWGTGGSPRVHHKRAQQSQFLIGCRIYSHVQMAGQLPRHGDSLAPQKKIRGISISKIER